MPASDARTVPAYLACGRRIRNYSVDAAVHLDALSVATARRNRYGAVVSLHFRNEHRGSPLRAVMQPGQRYSFQERVGEGRAWRHKDLPDTFEAFYAIVDELAA